MPHKRFLKINSSVGEGEKTEPPLEEVATRNYIYVHSVEFHHQQMWGTAAVTTEARSSNIQPQRYF